MSYLSSSRKQYIRQLDRAFYDMDQKLHFLHEIDLLISNKKLNIDSKLDNLCRQFKDVCQADLYAQCFLNNNEIRIHFENNQDNIEFFNIISSSMPNVFYEEKSIFKSAQDDAGKDIGILFVPIFDNEDLDAENNKMLFCVVALITHGIDSKYDPLNDEGVEDYSSMVSTQLSILITNALQMRREKFEYKIVNFFFNDRFSYFSSLNASLKEILSFLPDWKHFKLKNPPLIQFLSFSSINSPLIIESATEGEALLDNEQGILGSTAGTPVIINDSICGILINKALKDDKITHININPMVKYKNKYKAFRNKNIPQSEMVVVLKIENKIIGVLNFEHEDPNIFSEYHIYIAEKAAKFIAPFYFTTKKNMNLLRQKESSLLYTMSGFLVRLNATYMHKTTQKIPIIYDLLNDLKFHMGEDNIGLEYVNKITSEFTQYTSLSTNFLKSAPHYIKKGPIQLKTVIYNAIKEFDPTNPRNENQVKFQVSHFDTSIHVFASQFLQEHIFNLLSNARYSVLDNIGKGKLAKDKGLIEIIITRIEYRDRNGKPTKGARIHFAIIDNGTGVSKEIYHEICKYNFTTKRDEGGTGYGLPAAIDYIRSLSGDLSYENTYNESNEISGLMVKFYLEEFNEEYHKREE